MLVCKSPTFAPVTSVIAVRNIPVDILKNEKKKKRESVSHSVVSYSAISWTVACQAPVHGILQARILEWVAIPFSRGFCPPRD